MRRDYGETDPLTRRGWDSKDVVTALIAGAMIVGGVCALAGLAMWWVLR